jgi:hypothetical protein
VVTTVTPLAHSCMAFLKSSTPTVINSPGYIIKDTAFFLTDKQAKIRRLLRPL